MISEIKFRFTLKSNGRRVQLWHVTVTSFHCEDNTPNLSTRRHLPRLSIILEAKSWIIQTFSLSRQQKMFFIASIIISVCVFISLCHPFIPRLLMICCDFKRQNMEIAQRGSGIYFSITSVTNYSAQHAESVAPVDPFPPFILFIWRKGYIVSYTTRCT